MAEGFESVYVLRRGLEAWKQSGFPTVPIEIDAPHSRGREDGSVSAGSTDLAANSAGAAHPHTFLPGLVENYVNRHDLPLKRDLTVLFVDIADSTATIVGKSPDEALAYVQRFMGVVTEAALAYCGDVKDYEGDGALLYFESVTEATQAALAIRHALTQATAEAGQQLRARLSLDVGCIVIGVIGTPLRRSVALIGPSINLAARLLKQIPPDGVIATEAVVERLREETPALAERFALFDERLELKGFEREFVTAYSVRD
jgi:class 3 adenylate cyclase